MRGQYLVRYVLMHSKNTPGNSGADKTSVSIKKPAETVQNCWNSEHQIIRDRAGRELHESSYFLIQSRSEIENLPCDETLFICFQYQLKLLLQDCNFRF